MTRQSVGLRDLVYLDFATAERIRASLPASQSVGSAACAGRALSDPTRLTIAAALLGANELCVGDIAWVVKQRQNLVSHHLRQLRTAGLAASRRRGSFVMYRLTERGAALTGAVMGSDSKPAGS